jgi:hypothetical protein
MLQPINYSLNVKTPFEAAVEGYKVGLAGQEALAQRQALEAQRAKAVADAEKIRQEAQRERDEVAAVQSLLAKSNANADDYRRVAATLSADRRKMLEDNFAALTKEEQASQLQFGGQVMSALVGKKPDVALNLLTTRAQAERNAGREDKAKATESTIEMMKLNPDNAMHILGISMAGVPGFDKVLETATAAMKPPETKEPYVIIPGVGWLPRAQLLREVAASEAQGTQDVGVQGAIPANAVTFLKSNPNTKAEFDRKFGAGAADRILGVKK